jgi:sugar phosphate isomerase/epimerase
MELAVCIGNVPKIITDEWAANLEENGVTALEPGRFAIQNKPTEVFRKEAEIIYSHGIKIHTVHGPFNQHDLSTPDEESRLCAIKLHLECMESASAAGIECMVIHPSPSFNKIERESRLEQLDKSLTLLVKEAEKYKVRLALENLPNDYLGNNTIELRNILKSFNSYYLGTCFDTGHANLTEEGVLYAFDILEDTIINFHLQDNDQFSDKHLQPPYGTINWKKVFEKIKKMNFKRPISVEADPWAKNSWKQFLQELYALADNKLLTTEINGKELYVTCPNCNHYCYKTNTGYTCMCNN